jgi:hypothetical protein
MAVSFVLNDKLDRPIMQSAQGRIAREEAACHWGDPPQLLANTGYNFDAAVVRWRVPCRVGVFSGPREKSVAGN